MIDKYSHEFNKLVDHFHQLKGVGRRTALRYALDVLNWNETETSSFGLVLTTLKDNVKLCKICYNLSDSEVCNICNNAARDGQKLCVVHDIRDVIAIESTGQYNGKYHVLGGKISPMDGIGPSELKIEQLTQRVAEGGISEIILALSTDMEGETTGFYIYKKLADYTLDFSTIARGIALGDELEYTDEQTLASSIKNRVPYEKQTM